MKKTTAARCCASCSTATRRKRACRAVLSALSNGSTAPRQCARGHLAAARRSGGRGCSAGRRPRLSPALWPRRQERAGSVHGRRLAANAPVADDARVWPAQPHDAKLVLDMFVADEGGDMEPELAETVAQQLLLILVRAKSRSAGGGGRIAGWMDGWLLAATVCMAGWVGDGYLAGWQSVSLFAGKTVSGGPMGGHTHTC